jgi:hypothetical protein
VIGWYAMVTGQVVVLYCRLHLVVNDTRQIRWVFIMITIDFFIFYVPTTILFLANNLGQQHYINEFSSYEKIQLIGFTLQECIISFVYVWETVQGLKPVLAVKGPEARKYMAYGIVVNVLAVLLDISLCAMELTGHFDIQTTYKPLVYGIKLKMEIYVINSLLGISQQVNCNCISDVQIQEVHT